MDPDARRYQDQLHAVNQERMGRIEDKVDRTLTALSAIAVAIEIIPGMVKRIEELEAERNQRKGALVVLGFMSGLLGAGIEVLIKHLMGK